MKPWRAALVLALVAPAASGAAEKVKPAEVVASHLDAVGTAESRGAARRVEGSCTMSAPASGEVTFADFKPARGLNVPSSWTIRYETQAKVTQYWKHDMAAETLGK